MNWEDERYVRLYTRDTPEWLALSWQARGLLALILRAVDRAGVLKTGKLGLKGVAVAVHAPWANIEAPLRELLDDGCIVFHEEKGALFMPNFLDAQECKQTDAARKRASREKARATFGGTSDASERARALLNSQDVGVTKRDSMQSQNVTDCPGSADSADKTAEKVTRGHTESHAVTLNRAFPSLPNQPSPPQPPQGGAVVVEVEEGQEGNPLEPEEAPEVRKIYAKEKYRLAYEAGISRGKGGVRYAMPREQEGHLGQVIEAFAVETRTGDPLVGEVLIEWIGDHAEWFAKWLLSQPENVAGYYSAFGPKGLLKRLNEVKGRAA